MDRTSFENRRKALFAKMRDNSVAILSAANIVYRNSDTEFPYRQNSHFYYLTGFNEHHAIAVFIKKQNQNHFVLFCQENDLEAEKWTGPRWGLEGAKKQFCADETYSIKAIDNKILELLQNITTIYHIINGNQSLNKKIFGWVSHLKQKVRQGIQVPYEYSDLSKLLNEQRLIKSTEEISAMQKASDISVLAHKQAMTQARVGMYEYELEAILLKTFYESGSRSPAYPSIVAAGNNACILHYTQNNTKIAQNDLVLIDAGAEYDLYASDITRTFPVSGQFTAEQKAIYELVLQAQKAAIEKAVKENAWDQMQKAILKILVEGLVDLKILKGTTDSLIEQKAYFPFYMHNSGHWLGMDVHDVGEYRQGEQWRLLEPGMVLTIEPGLYISPSNTDVAEKWRGIGVRIEDDILITESKPKILTDKLPKEIADIEHLMK